MLILRYLHEITPRARDERPFDVRFDGWCPKIDAGLLVGHSELRLGLSCFS
jgi:hypothetical protein